MRTTTCLSSDGVVVYVDEVSFRRAFLVPRRVGEPLAEDHSEADVVAAASPLELARRRLVGQRAAAALGRRSRAARLGDRLRQRGRRQRVHVRLLATACIRPREALSPLLISTPLEFTSPTSRSSSSTVRLSVRLSVCPMRLSTAAAPCGGFAAVGPAGRRYRLIAARPAPSSNCAAAARRCSTMVFGSKCEQCHVSSRRRRPKRSHRLVNCNVVCFNTILWYLCKLK